MLLLLVPIDLAWVFDEMRRYPEHGRDADFVFWFGVLLRAFLFNTLLLPVNWLGLKRHQRQRAFPIEMTFG